MRETGWTTLDVAATLDVRHLPEELLASTRAGVIDVGKGAMRSGVWLTPLTYGTSHKTVVFSTRVLG